ncbi:MAG: protein kinase [Myxococcota bacterium]
MEGQDYQRAYSVFMAIADLEGASRARALDEACKGDAELRKFVSRLLDETSISTIENALDRAVAASTGLQAVELELGTRVQGRYEVQALLGRGGTSSVWKVFDTELWQPHALKVLELNGPVSRERMRRERAFQDDVRHRNVVTVQELLEVDGRLALLTELVDGPDLSAFLREHALSESQIDAIALGIFAGVQAIHDAGLIHRDIKPSNVLLAREGTRYVPKIADFGIAQAIDGRSPNARLTQTGAWVGTLAYMAPEQIRQVRAVDHRVDIWAVSCLLYRMVTGRGAFEGADNGETLTAILEGRRPQLPESLPLRWRAAIDAGLRLRPDDRPSSCVALRTRWEAPNGVLIGEEPIPSSPNPNPLTLPTPRNRFIGRRGALTDVATRLRSHRLVTLLGIGGLGKTRLAIELGRQLHGEWAGGVRLVPLADTHSAEGIRSATADALGVPRGRDPDAQVVEALRSLGPMLLILDNFEQIVDHAAETVGHWLDLVPTLRVLVTSRTPLQLYGEQHCPLDLLPESEALQLFAERAREVNHRFSPDEHRAHLVKLVHLLDRLPLAIELAAARSRLLSPRALLDRMSRRFDVLRTAANDLPERHRTLWATLQWSWELLTPLQRSVLAQLSVFEDGFTVEAAQGVVDLGATTGWVEDVLAELISKGLLRHEEGRLRMLVSVQAFAAAQLADPTKAERRHGTWFHTFATSERSERAFNLEHENLIAAARRAARRGETSIASGTGVRASDIFYMRGPARSGIELLDEILPVIQQPHLRAPLLREKGRLLNRIESAGVAAQAHLEAIELARTAGLHDELSSNLGYLGEHAADQGRWDEVERLFTESEEAARRDGRAHVVLVPVLRLARLALARGQHEQAEQRFSEAVALSKTGGRPRFLSYLYGMLGNLRFRQRRLSEARQCYESAVQHAHDNDDAMSVANWTIGLATVAESQGDYPVAIERIRGALRLAAEVGGLDNEVHLVAFLGYVLHRRGQRAEAEPQLRRAVELAEARQHMLSLQNARTELGHLLVMDGRLDEAEPFLRDAFETSLVDTRHAKKPWIHAYLGELCDARGNVEEARAIYDSGLDTARALNDPIPLGRLMALRARCLDNAEAGRAELDEAERIVREAQDRYELALLLCDRALFEAQRGASERAHMAMDDARRTIAGMALESHAEVIVKLQRVAQRLQRDASGDKPR